MGTLHPDIVFEGVTEAGITRMLWLYSDINKIPDKVGSLRSARHDFVEIAEGLDAIFVHWGGSKYAYSAISERNVDDLDGRSYLGRYFFRDKERTNVAIEHRGYTTREAIDKGLTNSTSAAILNPAIRVPLHLFPKARRALPPAAHARE